MLNGGPTLESRAMINEKNIELRFVDLLDELTKSGKLEWAQKENEPGFVYCLASEELIVFELRGGTDGAHVRPSEAIAGIVSRCRNVSYLWLEGINGWDTLLRLLRSAPIDDERFIKMRVSTQEVPVHVLEALVSKAG